MICPLYKSVIEVANIADKLQAKDPKLNRIEAIQQAIKIQKKEVS